jgi:signal transduction histidine kinase
VEERRLPQALSHRVSNAVKASGAVSAGASLVDIERVFEPFSRLDGTPGRRCEATGIGLNVSRALVAAHAGDLSWRNAPGQGTTTESPTTRRSPYSGIGSQALADTPP